MAEEFSRSVLIKVVAQICQMIGFDKIMTSPMLILADILKGFILKLGRISHRYGEHCGRPTFSLSDLSCAFNDCGVRPDELVEFLKCVSPLPECIIVPRFPVVKKNIYTFPTTDVAEIENCQPESCNETNDTTREVLKVKISLSKIKEARRSKHKKYKKKKRKKECKRVDKKMKKDQKKIYTIEEENF